MNMGVLRVSIRGTGVVKRRTSHENLRSPALARSPENSVSRRKVRCPLTPSGRKNGVSPMKVHRAGLLPDGEPSVKKERTAHEGTAYLRGTTPYRPGKNGVLPMKEQRTTREIRAYPS